MKNRSGNETQKANQSGLSPANEHAVPTVKAGEFPAAGHTYRIDFGAFGGKLHFKSEKELTFTVSMTGGPEMTETVAIEVTKLRPNLFMVTWTEASGNKVVHVEDFENETVYTNAFMPNGQAIQSMKFSGPLTKLQ